MEISSFECHLNVHVQNLKVDTMLPGTKAQMHLKTQSTLSTFDDFNSTTHCQLLCNLQTVLGTCVIDLVHRAPRPLGVLANLQTAQQGF